METRAKSSTEFRSEIHELISSQEARNAENAAKTDTRFEQLIDLIAQSNARFDQITQDLQALRLQQNNQPISSHIRPAFDREPHYQFRSTTNRDPTVLDTGETSNNSMTAQHHSNLKLNFPTYNGLDDPTGWIFKAEQYIEFKQIDPQQQVQLASFHLEKIALQWYRWFTKNRGPLRWNEFTTALLHRFGPTDYDDPSEALSRLKQTTTVNAYQVEFEKLSHKIDDLQENFLVGSFIAGLKDEIRLDVRVKQPRTLSDAISVAHLIEERNQLQRRPTNSFRPAVSVNQNRVAQSSTIGLLGPAPAQHAANNVGNFPGPIRRFTGQEVRERREKGLCFYCNEKYVPGHRCSRPQLCMMVDVLSENEIEDIDMEIEPVQETIP